MGLFKNLKLSKAETLWLKAIYENGGIPDPKTFKVKLRDQLPPNFKYANLHQCFVWDNRLSIHGIWIVNPKDKVFNLADKVIRTIQGKIIENPVGCNKSLSAFDVLA